MGPSKEQAYFGNYESVGYSPNRPRVWYPEIASEKSVDQYSRNELMKKSSWAFDNVAFVRGLLLQISSMCSASLVPKAETDDEEWNKQADRAFRDATGNAEKFDLAGKLNWRSWCKAVFLGTYRLGDCGTMLAMNEDGSPVIKFIESYAIESPPENETLKGETFSQGIQLDKHGKAIGFSIKAPDDSFTTVPRMNLVFACQYDKPGQLRGIPKTQHMLNAAQDGEEIKQSWSTGIKMSSRIGMQLVNAKHSGTGDSPFGGSQTVAKTEVGEINVDRLHNSSQILQLGDERVELLHDDRPAPNQVDFLNYCKRAMCLGLGASLYEYIWDMEALKGANTRATLEKVHKWVTEQQDWFIDTVGQRVRNWVIASLIEQGILPMNEQYERCSWMRGARLSSDFAKDGRLLLDYISSGNLSPDRVAESQGIDIEEEDRRTIERHLKRQSMCEDVGVDYNRVFTPPNGTAAAAIESADTQNEPTENNEESTEN